jgi:Rrf2 family transcriptional regulator, cysteine metabolism repressor
MFKPQKKDQYALRAILELAKRKGGGPIKISEIAEAQKIPLRFLEVILNQLKGSGFVLSKRGFHGGYRLVPAARDITVGDIFRFMQGDRETILCVASDAHAHCDQFGECALAPFWCRVQETIYRICDETTIQDLLDHEKRPD